MFEVLTGNMQGMFWFWCIFWMLIVAIVAVPKTGNKWRL